MSGERHLLVTSTTADEGKTSVALALANIAAALGEKVLLIDANLGRAAAAKRLGVTMRSGLTDILQGDCTLESVVVTTRAGFDVIPPGTRAGSYAARKLARDTLDGVMHSSASYDLVLIDGPAWDAGTEASRLAQAVDGVLWCARWGHTNLDELGAAVTEYRDEAGAARVLGIVFTSVDLGELQWFETGTRMSAKRVPRKLDDGPVDVQPRAPHAPERQ
jgi:Mrp family chromosome partitioning ATPase